MSLVDRDNVDYSPYNYDAKEKICTQHIQDDFIHNSILQNGEIGCCDYCGKKGKVVGLNHILDLIVVGIETVFEDPVESRYLNHDAEYGFDGNIFDFTNLWFQDLLELEIEGYELNEDLYNYLFSPQIYCYRDEFYSESEFLQDSWNNFKNTVKHRARFVFYYKNIFSNFSVLDPISILNQIQKFISDYQLFQTFEINTNLYRCRQHQEINEIKSKADLVSAPDEKALNGRMNPVGISMFYCSNNKQVTIDEVVDFRNKKKPYFTVGLFKNKKELKLIDLTNIPSTPSIFDLEKRNNIENIKFLNGFVSDIIKPINKTDSSLGYIPTQIVTEYLKFNPKLESDGLIFPSSKSSQGSNLVLFYNAEESLENLEFKESKTSTYDN